MTLIFYGNDNSGGGGGIPKSAIQLWTSENGVLGTLADITDIAVASENTWSADLNGTTVYLTIETDAMTGEEIFNVSTDDETLTQHISCEYMMNILPTE